MQVKSFERKQKHDDRQKPWSPVPKTLVDELKERPDGAHHHQANEQGAHSPENTLIQTGWGGPVTGCHGFGKNAFDSSSASPDVHIAYSNDGDDEYTEKASVMYYLIGIGNWSNQNQDDIQA